MGVVNCWKGKYRESHKYGGRKLLEGKIWGGHTTFDYQNVGSHKITTDHRLHVYFVLKD